MQWCILSIALIGVTHSQLYHEPYTEKYLPTKCESCLLFAQDMESAVARVPKRLPRAEEESVLLDELENICANMLQYRIHKDQSGLNRFSRQRTKAANVLRQLKERGVDVRMELPDEVMDQPSIESGQLKQDCEWIIEEFEQEIEKWFFEERGLGTLKERICEGRLGSQYDNTCLPDEPNKEL